MWENSWIIEKIKDQKNLILVLLLYTFLAIILFSHYKYVINSDGIAYISIAKHYLNGHISYAINGYWSPLYSWLLIPFIYSWPGNIGNVMVTKVLAIVLGLLTLLAVNSILDKLSFDIRQKTIILLALIPFMLFSTFYFVSPDLLVACILLYYFNYLIDNNYRKSTSLGVITGILGVMAFLAKSYCFYFFLVHFVLVNLFFMKNFPKDRSVIKKNLLLGLSIFLLISGVWAGIISEKYGEVTVGTSGSYNYAIMGPEYNDHVMRYQILSPPNEFAVSSWEDPSYFKVKKWSPLESKQNFTHLIMIIFDNIWRIILISGFSVFIPFLVITLSLYLFFKSDRKSIRNNLILILGTMIIYAGGYILIIILIRYLFFVFLLSFLMGFYSLNMLFKENIIKPKFVKLISILLVLLLFFYPILLMSYYSDGHSDGFFKIKKSLDLKSQGIRGNIASNGEWERMDNYCYYLDSKYYGVTKNQSGVELKDTLMRYDIDYYFVWGKSYDDYLGDIVYRDEYLVVYRIKK
jgi:hypothetical protein